MGHWLSGAASGLGSENEVQGYVSLRVSTWWHDTDRVCNERETRGTVL